MSRALVHLSKYTTYPYHTIFNQKCKQNLIVQLQFVFTFTSISFIFKHFEELDDKLISTRKMKTYLIVTLFLTGNSFIVHCV